MYLAVCLEAGSRHEVTRKYLDYNRKLGPRLYATTGVHPLFGSNAQSITKMTERENFH